MVDFTEMDDQGGNAHISPDAYWTRAKAALAILLLMPALAICTLIGHRSVARRSANQPDRASRSEARLSGLRRMLPPRVTVGYISDLAGEKETIRDYFLTQYWLAPVTVARDTSHDFVVASCTSPASASRIAAANGLVVVRQFHNGVALLRRPVQ